MLKGLVIGFAYGTKKEGFVKLTRWRGVVDLMWPYEDVLL
jgi:hypothetical protein